METEYRQDLCKRTMTVRRYESEKSSFREKMIMKNSVRGLARVSIRHMNGESYYSYDMGSCQTLKNVFDGNPMERQELKSLFSGILAVSKEIGKYLLDVKDLMMSPEHIFWDLEKGAPLFCYYPENPEGEEGFNALGQFLMDAADKKDEEATAAAYDYYDRISEGILLPGDVYEKAEDEDRSRSEDMRIVSEPAVDDGFGVFESGTDALASSKLWDDDSSDNYYFEETAADKKDGEKKGRYLVLLSFIPALLAAAAYGFIYMNPQIMESLNLTDSDYIRSGIAVTIFSGIFITVGVYIWNKRRREEEDRKRDMDSLNSDAKAEEYRFDELEERAMEEFHNEDAADNNATVILSDFSGGGRAGRKPELCGRVAGENRVYKIERTPYMIGKMRNKADGVIADPRVSRIHACIREDGGRYYLSDLNSTNGTCLNERKLNSNETAELFDGDTVRFADISMTFRLA